MRALSAAITLLAALACAGCAPTRYGTVDPSEVAGRNDDAWRITATPTARQAPLPSSGTER